VSAPDSKGPDAMDAMREVTDRARTLGSPSPSRLAAFLARQPDLGGRLEGIKIDATLRSSGASSGTVLLDAYVTGDDGDHTALPLVFRYDLGGTFFFQYDLIAQFKTMRALELVGFPAPHALWLDAEGEVAGKPGLFMRRVDAPAPGGQPFAEGPLASADEYDRHAMILNAVRCFAALHALEPASLPLDHLRGRGQGDTFIARALDWDSKELLHAIPPGFGAERASYYDTVRTDLLRVRDHLRAEAPPYQKAELAHGDTNLSNVMYHGSEVAALLDWELCHLGLGEADLAYCIAGMAHFQLTLDPIPGIPTQDEILAAYKAARGGLRDWSYCELWGEWRLGVYQTMAFSRLPAAMRHIEELYWTNTRSRLSRLLPL